MSEPCFHKTHVSGCPRCEDTARIIANWRRCPAPSGQYPSEEQYIAWNRTFFQDKDLRNRPDQLNTYGRWIMQKACDWQREKGLRMAHGCHDYNGGYHGAQGEAFHAGIDTIISVLNAADSGEESVQMAVVEAIGASAIRAQADHPVEAAPAERPLIARALAEWHEDDGPACWWAWCGREWAGEPAWLGTPLDSNWPGYHTHWTPHPAPPSAQADSGRAAHESGN